MKLSQFIGRQMSRLKSGQTYYSIFIQTMTALGVLDMAFESIPSWIFIVLSPVVLFIAYFIGYVSDKSDVISLDYRKTLEMAHRYLNYNDLKMIDFQMLQMEVFYEWFNALKENKPLDQEILREKYENYLKKWNPPEEKTKWKKEIKKKG